MTKADRVRAALKKQPVDHVPASFSIHFPKAVAHGDAAIKAHLDFYHETDVDILKVMNENLFPSIGEMNSPSDWNKLPAYDRHAPFIQREMELLKALRQAEPDAYLMLTVHGICASTIHPLEARYGYEPVRELFVRQMRSDKDPLLEARTRIADALVELVQTARDIGCDGIYYAALGAEDYYYSDEEFAEAVAPYDITVLKAIRETGQDVFLHMCKDHLNMNRFRDYVPFCKAANWGVYEVPFSLQQGKSLFPDAASMGGLANRSGVLVNGTEEEIRSEVHKVLQDFGAQGFILGADCTLPTDIELWRVKAAVEAAREFS